MAGHLRKTKTRANFSGEVDYSRAVIVCLPASLPPRKASMAGLLRAGLAFYAPATPSVVMGKAALTLWLYNTPTDERY